jgi:adenylate cyclase
MLIAGTVILAFCSVHFIKEVRRWEGNFVHGLELKYLDHKFQTRGPVPVNAKVVIAAVDEKSIARFGVWGSWDRTVFAEMITNLVEAGAAVVAFDAIFADQSRADHRRAAKRLRESLYTLGLASEGAEGEGASQSSPVETWLDSNVEDPGAPAVRAALSNIRDQMKNDKSFWSDPDQSLQEAFDEHSDRVVQGYVAMFKEDADTFYKAQLAVPQWLTDNEYIDAVYQEEPAAAGEKRKAVAIEPPAEALMRMPFPHAKGGLISPLDRFTEPGEFFGYFSIAPDDDGTLRHMHLMARLGTTVMPSLALQCASIYFGASILPLANELYPNALGGVRFMVEEGGGGKDPVIPTDQMGRMIINYLGPPGEVFPRLSVADIVDAMPPAKALEAMQKGEISAQDMQQRVENWNRVKRKVKDRVVLFGTTAIGTYDQRITPYSDFGPGVEVHAAAVQNIVSREFLQRPWFMATAEVFGMLLLGFLLAIIISNVSVPMSIAALFMIVGFWYVGDIQVLFPSGYWTYGILPFLCFFTVWAALLVYGYLTEGRERAKTRKVLEGYVSPSVAQQVMENSALLNLGGEEKDLTVIFSDIRGFTTMSEQFDAGELTNFLNEYFTPMTAIIFEHGGTLDKYMGDAIMAFFGAPGEMEDHADKGMIAALEMVDCLHALNERWWARGLPGIDIGIGLNSGSMRVGNMGSTQRMDYTVLGDNVNLGSRLEGINKQYGTRVIVSEETVNRSSGAVFFRELDAVRVKGKLAPVRIFEVVGQGEPDEETAAWIDAYQAGLLAYRSQNWAEAIHQFETVLDHRDDDLASRVFIERARSLQANPPGDDWDGVFTMTSK